MSSSLSTTSSPFLLIDNHRCYAHRCDATSIFTSPIQSLNFSSSKHRRVRLHASVAERVLSSSWLAPERTANDGYGGWEISESGFEGDNKKGLPRFLLVGAGASVAILLATIAYCSFSKKGYRFQFITPLRTIERILVPSDATSQSDVADSNASGVDSMESAASPEHISDRINEIDASASVEDIKRVVIPAVVDSTQSEALLVLKKLKIIEDDVKGEELCSRREYARWLIKANAVLERNPKHRMIPTMLLAGSWVQAFDDVNIEDPDFWSIQALAEAGLVYSKLSDRSSSSSDRDNVLDKGRINFFPERFISRLDLLDWKAQLEYSFIQGIKEKISRKTINLLDVGAISQDASLELFMDMQAGDKSILRKVFGQSRRFQPHKLATKAQAAVALTSGRMAAAIQTELSRIEEELSSRRAVMEEIRSELLRKEEIQKFWETKMNEVKTYGLDIVSHFQTAIQNLEHEKTVQDSNRAKLLKEKAALDCQKQLLLSLKEEVDDMVERFTREKEEFSVEQNALKSVSSDLQTKKEATMDAKSILEAEKEALQILRSWVEDEARQNQARAKVLETAGRRWKWEEQG